MPYEPASDYDQWLHKQALREPSEFPPGLPTRTKKPSVGKRSRDKEDEENEEDEGNE